MSVTFLRVPASRWTHLESLVMRLVAECRRLQRENLALAHAIGDREEEISRLRSLEHEQGLKQSAMTHFLTAKDQIQERIDDLIARIDLVELPVPNLVDIEE